MNFGLVGWGIASGNGGMNTDIATLATWVTHWLVPAHPDGKNHKPYLDKARNYVEVIECELKKDHEKYNYFLSKVDAIIYIEHPVLRDQRDFDIVSAAKKLGKLVVGIPMWEWWPERTSWALETDILISVTNFTTRYLNSLSDVLYVHGTSHNWRNKIINTRWGVNLEDFKFRERKKVERIVFVNGNGGYKLRKASDLVFEAFSKQGAPPLTVMSQRKNIAQFSVGKNISLIENNFANREDVYREGDLFLFPSYWEGLCHGLYEAQRIIRL
jgi:glycosyltransferase involved in cell wall biosynthesis